MKKALAILIVLLCFVQAQASSTVVVVGQGAAAACSNNPATDYGGYSTAGETAESASSTNIGCQRYQFTNMTCDTGTLKTAYIYDRRDDVDAEQAVVCVYETDTGTDRPDADDTLIGCSNVITGGTSVGWYSAEFPASYTVNKNGYYHVCIWANQGVTWYHRSDGSSQTSFTNTKSGTTPPDNCGDFDSTPWAQYTSVGAQAVYISIE